MTAPDAAGTTLRLPPASDALPLGSLHIAALVFQRARQLKNGARPRVDASGHRPTRVALLEVMAERISWTVG
jgi:hypothetical protein